MDASLEALTAAANVSEDVAHGWRTDATRLLRGYRLTRTEGIDTKAATTMA